MMNNNNANNDNDDNDDEPVAMMIPRPRRAPQACTVSVCTVLVFWWSPTSLTALEV